jgi:uncharacterized protein (TIGR04255 family)
LSRLPDYPKWEEFATEALSLWGKYAALTKPVEIQRIGVRFINRIPIPAQAGDLNDYLVNAPKSWGSFPVPFAGFVHSDTFSVPDTNYLIHVVGLLQITKTTLMSLVGQRQGGSENNRARIGCCCEVCSGLIAPLQPPALALDHLPSLEIGHINEADLLR